MGPAGSDGFQLVSGVAMLTETGGIDLLNRDFPLLTLELA
jgi:hypothetical protein